MRNIDHRLLLPVLAAAALIAGCSSTHLVESWQDPATAVTPATPTRSVLVVAMNQDQVSRRIWEDEFVEAFAARQVAAHQAYQIFPGGVPDTSAVLERVGADGYDAVLVVSRARSQKEVEVVPARRPQRWGYYNWYYDRVREPATVETTLKIQVNTEFLRAEKGDVRLVWAGTSETVDPSSRAALRSSVAEAVVKELASAKILR
jgi:hypothetical protein